MKNYDANFFLIKYITETHEIRLKWEDFDAPANDFHMIFKNSVSQLNTIAAMIVETASFICVLRHFQLLGK